MRKRIRGKKKRRPSDLIVLNFRTKNEINSTVALNLVIYLTKIMKKSEQFIFQ